MKKGIVKNLISSFIITCVFGNAGFAIFQLLFGKLECNVNNIVVVNYLGLLFIFAITFVFLIIMDILFAEKKK
jgi:hypothetical protein